MSKNRYIWLHGEKVPVDEELYRAYYRAAWCESKRKKIRANVERSYEQILKNGHDLQADSKLVDDIVADKMLLKELYVAKQIKNPEQQTLLELRYLCFRTWEQISVDMRYSIQNSYKVHDKALISVASLIE